MYGLGEIFNDGYVFIDYVVVDENYIFDGNNDVIEKFIIGFKIFKEGVFKYLIFIVNLSSLFFFCWSK